MNNNHTDCILFIDDEMARFCIAYQRANGNIETVAEIIGCGPGQARQIERRARAVGVIGDFGQVTETAEKCIKALIKQRVESFKS